MLKRKIRAYLSHPIQGRAGKAATPEMMETNNRIAIAWTKRLDIYFGSNLELYVPGEHDEFVLIAYLDEQLTIEQILDIDCKILAKRDVLLVANWENHLSGGMKREIDKAKELGIPIRVFDNIEEADLRALEIWLEEKFNE